MADRNHCAAELTELAADGAETVVDVSMESARGEMAGGRSSRQWLIGILLAALVAGCATSGDRSRGESALRRDAQAQLDSLTGNDPAAAFGGWSNRCRSASSPSELRTALTLIHRRLPAMRTWHFEILGVQMAGKQATVRTVVVDRRGQVVHARGFWNNEDPWPFVFEDGAWRNDFCNP